MPDNASLIGRDEAVQVVRDLVDRPLVNKQRRSQLRPVLVVEGTRGTGKSALLQDLGVRLDQRAPHARIDFEACPDADVPQILSAVAFALGEYCPGYDAISFPRLAIARLVMEQDLDLNNRKAASAQVTALLATERGLDSLRAGLGRTAGVAVSVLQGRLNVPDELAVLMQDAGQEVARGAFTSFLRGRRTRRIALGPSIAWFGHRGRGLSHDAIDRLIELNRWADDPQAGDHRQAIDELVWDAFLTDLRQHFAGKGSDDWLFNCVLLMDNVDTPVGEEFLSGLIRNRGTRREDPDPLTAVATSTGAFLAYRDPQEIAEGGTGDGESGWQRFRRYRLSDLSHDDVIDMTANTGLRIANTARMPIMVHQLTEGHPAATQLIITTIAQHESVRDHPVALLERQEPAATADRLTVAERLLTNLLGEFPRDAFEELITCSAAADVEHRRALGGRSRGSERRLAQIDQLLWPPVGGAGPRVLRKLLLPLLGERSDSHPASWENVFRDLRTGRESAGDEPGALYYALAGGDLPHVVGRLEQDLDRLGCDAWDERLLAVTAAPRRRTALAPGVSPPSPDEQCRELLRQCVPEQSTVELARLVAGLWIVNDPMTDARRRGLHEQIANDYEWLAGHSEQDSVQRYRQNAHRHRRFAALWPWN